jgi:hypothetical protein
MSGTIQWKWSDSNGLEYTFNIPGSLYVPEGMCRLLSPQHQAQAHKEATGMQAWEVTDDQGCTLYWEGGRKHLTILLGNKDNVATKQRTPGYSRYHKFSDSTPANHEHNPIIMHPATAVSDDEGGIEDDQEDSCTSIGADQESTSVEATEKEPIKPTATDFNLNRVSGEKIPEVNIIEEDVQGTNLAAEILRIHHCMGHMLFAQSCRSWPSKEPCWQGSGIACFQCAQHVRTGKRVGTPGEESQ